MVRILASKVAIAVQLVMFTVYRVSFAFLVVVGFVSWVYDIGTSFPSIGRPAVMTLTFIFSDISEYEEKRR